MVSHESKPASSKRSRYLDIPNHERVISRSEGPDMTGSCGDIDLVERMLGRNHNSYGEIMSEDSVSFWELVSVLGATQVTVPQWKAPAAFVLGRKKLSVNGEHEKDF